MRMVQNPEGKWLCMWTATCEGTMVGVVTHPVLGYVPVCDKHKDISGTFLPMEDIVIEITEALS